MTEAVEEVVEEACNARSAPPFESLSNKRGIVVCRSFRAFAPNTWSVPRWAIEQSMYGEMRRKPQTGWSGRHLALVHMTSWEREKGAVVRHSYGSIHRVG